MEMMRDKQGIDPKEVEEKCIEFAEWISKHNYKHLITPVPGRSVWKADGGANYSLPYLFKQFIKEA